VVSETSGTTDLQFDKVEYAPPPSLACAACQAALTDEYFQANGVNLCTVCAHALDKGPPGGLLTRLAKAGLLGFLAALAGGAIWYGVRAATGLEIGLVAILVGVLVGRAVRFGSGNAGGRSFQFLAVALTYFGVAVNYVPDMMKAMGERAAASDMPMFVKLVVSTVLAFAVPFFGGVQNIIGILIIGFALWEAWKVNRRTEINIVGPLRVPEPEVAAPTTQAEVVAGG
jgi:hypothetical protein